MRYAVLGIVIGLALLAGGAAVWQYDKANQADRELQLLRHSVAHTDSIYRTDTLYFTRKLKVAVAMHDTVIKHLTDTILVKQFIAAQDTAIQACQSVVLTCEQRVAQRDSIIKLYKSLKPARIGIGLIGGCGYGVKGGDCIVGVGGYLRIF
jgi:hypothetical protein